MLIVTPAYAVVIALVFVALSVRTLRIRRELDVPIGHGDHPKLERAMRAHANFAEYVPISLLLVYFLEVLGASAIWIHALCICLFVGRIAHAYGVSQINEDYRYRVLGMALTFTVIICASIGILWHYFA